MQKKFSLFCFDEHRERSMSHKSKSKPRPKQPQHPNSKAVAKAVKAAKKRWEFNIIKTGNNQVNWNSGNTLGAARSRSIRPIAGPLMVGAPGMTGGSEIAVTNAMTRVREQVVEQDEVVGIMNGATSFEANVLDVNPGLSATFPWLAQLSALYERYSFDELVFYFKPLGSGFATNNQVGKVIICADYDSAEATPAQYRQAETMDPHADGMPFQCIELHLDPRRLNKEPKFIRLGPPPPSTDVKTYDAANVYFCASGTTNAAEIGEIRVRYRVRLMNPRLPGVAAQVTPNNTLAWGTNNNVGIATATETPIVVTSLLSNGIGASIDGTNIKLLQGNYLVTFQGYFINGSTNITQFVAMIAENSETLAAATAVNSTTMVLPGAAACVQLPFCVNRYVTVTGAGATINTRVSIVFAGGGFSTANFSLFVRSA